MWYHYHSKVGTFWIGPDGERRFWLGIDEEKLGSYHSARAAADDVYTQSSGHAEWDSLPTVMEPCDLTEWVRGRPDFMAR